MPMKLTIRYYDGPSDDVDSDPVGAEISATFPDVEAARRVAFEIAEQPQIRTLARGLVIEAEGRAVERWLRTKADWAPDPG
jgi:hypothetical protein